MEYGAVPSPKTSNDGEVYPKANWILDLAENKQGRDESVISCQCMVIEQIVTHDVNLRIPFFLEVLRNFIVLSGKGRIVT